MYQRRDARPTTAIYVQVKRNAETYFVLCDEYDSVETLKSKLLNAITQTGFTLDPRAEEPMTTDDIRLYLKKRVSTLPSAPVTACLSPDHGQHLHVPRLAGLQRLNPLLELQEAGH